jgi:hypothetical protein
MMVCKMFTFAAAHSLPLLHSVRVWEVDVERLTISLPAQVLELIDEQAQREGMTRSEWVRAALLRALAGRTM